MSFLQRKYGIHGNVYKMAGTTITGLKLDDGKGGYATNCFPVRSLAKQGEDGNRDKIL